LQLRLQESPDRIWAELPVISSDRDTGGEYDATLEVFREGQRLISSEIALEGLDSLLQDETSEVRLALNHCEGNPLLSVYWRIDGLQVVTRPSLSFHEGDLAWKVARALPCSEVRTYERGEDGTWKVRSELKVRSVERAKKPVEPPLACPTKDRYSEICGAIPTKPLAKPFGVRPMARRSDRDGFGPYRMTNQQQWA
jgi:hypothetical protein